MLFSVSQADAIQPPHNYQTTNPLYTFFALKNFSLPKLPI